MNFKYCILAQMSLLLTVDNGQRNVNQPVNSFLSAMEMVETIQVCYKKTLDCYPWSGIFRGNYTVIISERKWRNKSAEM